MVTAQVINASSVQVVWQWTRPGPAPSCFNATFVTYRFEGGGEASLQLSDPAVTEAILTDLQCSNYTITVVATAGEYRREGVAFLSLQGMLNACMEACAYYETCVCCHHIVFITLHHAGPPNVTVSVLSPTSVHLTWLSPCNTQQYNIYYRGTCGAYLDEGRFSTDQQQHTFDGLQEGINYTFTVNQTGFGGGGVLSTGPMYIHSFTAGR